jgi:hypothetical protein
MSWEEETAAALSRDFPDFEPTAVPIFSGGRRAWRGVLRPFARTGEIVDIVAHFEAERAVNILPGGVLHHDPDCTERHELSYAGALVNMDVEFEVVIVDRGEVLHPPVYCVRPPISADIYPGHPHPRQNEPALVGSTRVHGLCIHLRSEHTDRGAEMFVRLIDQTATYLAKHLVWVRTVGLMTSDRNGRRRCLLEEGRGLGAMLSTPDSRESGVGWAGHWPGPAVPHQPHDMLQMLSPDDE